jgi:vancomycin resistance protein VanJ
MQLTWRRIPLNLLLALINAYGFSVAAFLLLRWLVGESWDLIAFFNSIAHLLFIPAIILLPLALLLRRRVSVLLVLPALLAFVIGYAEVFVPRTAQASDAESLHILTYNMYSIAGNFDPLVKIIRDADADVVALQELSQPMADHLSVVLAEEYPYQATHTFADNPVPGQGVLSRYPIVDDTYWRVHLAMQRVTLDVDGPLVFYNAHPIMPLSRNGFDRRAEEITDLLARTARETHPVLLAGDFNMSDQSADYWRMSARYQDSYRDAGWGLGLTFPATMSQYSGRPSSSLLQWIPPVVRLDYVFHDVTFEAVDAHVWPTSGGSDHLPVLVSLARQSS